MTPDFFLLLGQSWNLLYLMSTGQVWYPPCRSKSMSTWMMHTFLVLFQLCMPKWNMVWVPVGKYPKKKKDSLSWCFNTGYILLNDIVYQCITVCLYLMVLFFFCFLTRLWSCGPRETLDVIVETPNLGNSSASFSQIRI